MKPAVATDSGTMAKEWPITFRRFIEKNHRELTIDVLVTCNSHDGGEAAFGGGEFYPLCSHGLVHLFRLNDRANIAVKSLIGATKSNGIGKLAMVRYMPHVFPGGSTASSRFASVLLARTLMSSIPNYSVKNRQRF